MDTRDPRFVSAYNDLVSAFFRFMNVVNPAPTRSDQIRLICDSMTALVDMLKAMPENDGDGLEISAPKDVCRQEGNLESAIRYDAGEGAVAESSVTHTSPAHDPAAASQPSAYPERRYSMTPDTTADDELKFFNKQLTREDPSQATDDDKDPDDYPFILEFDNDKEEGIFYLNQNPDINLSDILGGTMEEAVVEVIGSPKAGNFIIKKVGRIEKTRGGWLVVSPLVIGEKNS